MKIRKHIHLSLPVAITLLASTALITIALIGLLAWINDNSAIKAITEEIEPSNLVSEASDDDSTVVAPPSENMTNTDYWEFIKLPLISVDFSSLMAKNPDTVAWIQVKSTNINYPVVQASDNDFYLEHAFDRSRNSAGWVFADYRNNMQSFDKNTIIYGHGRLDTTLFGTLKKALDASWYANKQNHVIYLSTPIENTLWQVFSVYKTTPETYYLNTSFHTSVAYTEFLNTLTSRSVHNFGVTPTSSDKIITLSTCSNNSTSRVVLHARLIKSQAR